MAVNVAGRWCSVGGVIAMIAGATPARGADLIYWGNFDSNTIGFANLDGSGGGGQLGTGGATLDAPDGLAIDSPTGRLYWTNFGSTGNGMTISFASLGGGAGGILSAPGSTALVPGVRRSTRWRGRSTGRTATTRSRLPT